MRLYKHTALLSKGVGLSFFKIMRITSVNQAITRSGATITGEDMTITNNDKTITRK
jgi:hypothetical protein